MALKQFWQRTTRLDRLLVLILLGGSLIAIAGLCTLADGTWLVIEQGGQIIYRAPLAEDRRIVLPGALGETVIDIKAGSACVVDAACQEKICIGMGGIRRSGEIIACLPNQLLISVHGGQQTGRDYDLVSR